MKKILLLLLFLPLFGIAVAPWEIEADEYQCVNPNEIFINQSHAIPSNIGTVTALLYCYVSYEIQWVLVSDPVIVTNFSAGARIPFALTDEYKNLALSGSKKFHVRYTYYNPNYTSVTSNELTLYRVPVIDTDGDIVIDGIPDTPPYIFEPGVNLFLLNMTEYTKNIHPTGYNVSRRFQVVKNGVAEEVCRTPHIYSDDCKNYYDNNVTTNTSYRRILNNGCAILYSNTINVGIEHPLNAGTLRLDADDSSVCYGQTTSRPIIIQTLPSGGFGAHSYTYQWQRSDDNINFTDIAGATSTSYTPTPLISDTYFRIKTTSTFETYSVSAYSASVLVSIKDEYFGGSIDETKDVCFNTNPKVYYNSYPSDFPENDTYKYHVEYSFDNLNNWEILDNSLVEDIHPSAFFFSIPDFDRNTYFRVAFYSDCGIIYSNSCFVSYLPAVVPNLIGSDQTIDYNTSPSELTSISNAEGGSNSFSYQWQFSESITSPSWLSITNANATSYQPPLLVDTTYYRLRVTDNLCGVYYSNTITINVNPDLNPGAIGVEQLICNGTRPDTIRNTVDPSGGNGSYSYVWQRSPDAETWENISNSNFPYYRPVVLSEDAFFRRKVTSGSISKFTDHVHIAVDEPLAAPVVNGAGTFCRGTNVSLSVASPNPNFTYMWDFNGAYSLEGESITLDDLSQSFTINAFYINDIDCPSESTNVQVIADPVTADFYLTPTSAYAGVRVSFFSTSVNAVEWAWDLGLGEIYTSQNPSVYFNVPGSYDIALTVTSPNDCADTKILEDALSVSGETSADALASTPLRIYPNPSNGVFFVDLDSAPKFDRIRILSVSGAVVLDLPFEAFNGDISLDYAGVYLVQLLNGNSAFANAKIVKL